MSQRIIRQILQVRDDGAREEGLLQLAERSPQKEADGTGPGYETSTSLANDESLITQVIVFNNSQRTNGCKPHAQKVEMR